MKLTFAAASSTLVAFVSARQCQDLTVTIDAAARNGVFSLATPATDIDVTNFILNLAQQGNNYTADVLTGYATVGGTYDIAATYCQPDSGPSSAIQILTHGIGFDRTYWDLPFHNYNYSYVLEAVDQYGYSTFTWDRLGIGASSHGDPLSEIQALLEVDALRALTVAIQGGQVSGVPGPFDKVIHAGHSFGSQHTYALTAMYPDISDCITLQGFSQNGSFAGFFLLGSDFIEANEVAAFSTLPDGYFAAGSKTAVHIDFFAPGQFDPKILTYAYKNGQPVTVGELLTFGGETATINNFPGPVHIVTGERDVPYCGSNCLAPPTGYPNIPSTSAQYFPDASDFQVDIIPNAGHGLNLEYSHPTTYAIMLDYLVQNGCAPSSALSGYGHKKWGPDHH